MPLWLKNEFQAAGRWRSDWGARRQYRECRIVCLSRAVQFLTVQRSMAQSGHGRDWRRAGGPSPNMSKHQNPPDPLVRPLNAKQIPGDASVVVSVDDALPADPKFDA